jgi:hypothetical protein
VRQEQLAPIKPYLQSAYSETYHGMADLYVYFYQQGLRLLRQGGRMSYIVTNKWLRAGYGEPLRAFFAEQIAIEQIVDFGHAPIFEDADVFPSDAFVEEVRKRRPKVAGKLSPAALREGYAEQATPVQQRQAEAHGLERRLADLVNQAYGLTAEEIELLWRTAPPRMPVGQS